MGKHKLQFDLMLNGIGGVLLFGEADDRSVVALDHAQRDAEAFSRLSIEAAAAIRRASNDNSRKAYE